MDVDEVAFYTLEDNEQKVQQDLDRIRARRNKFICLNDDMNKSMLNKKIVDHIHDFYESFVPTPSPFELPPNKYNPYLYLSKDS